jgi:hypothetical protein
MLDGAPKTVGWHVRWEGKREESSPPNVIRELEKQPGIERLEFTVII